MAAKSKIVDEAEAKRWLIDEERPYSWIIEKYRTKYNIETGASMWSRARQRLGAEDFRKPPKTSLIPWTIHNAAHRTEYIPGLLRMVDRMRRGVASEDDAQRARSFIAYLTRANAVVHYDPDKGWFLVNRESYDRDIIRDPKHMRNPRTRSAK